MGGESVKEDVAKGRGSLISRRSGQRDVQGRAASFCVFKIVAETLLQLLAFRQLLLWLWKRKLSSVS